MWVGSVKRMKKFPGTWRVYAVSGNQTLFTRSIEVNTTPIPWNRPPEATLFITQAPTDNPLAILATVYAHDPEGNNTSVVWHIPEEGESKADFKDQISKTITFPAPGIYTLYVEINDDAPRYEEGSGFRVLKSETITVPLPPTTSPAIPNLVNGWGKCLDVHLPDLYTNGGKVQIWECMGTLNQQWFFNEHQQLVNGGGKCLDVHFPDLKTNGGKVQLWDCAPDLINQQWRLKGKTLVNGAGKCLDVHVPDRYTNGGKVQIWDCNDGLNQQWNNMITLVNEGGKCLDVHAPDLQMNGGKVQIWDCYGGLTQQWQFYHHQLVNAGGKCLDVYAPDLQKNGARIQIWECNGGPQQQWQFYQNRLVNGGGKCLDIHAPDLKKNGGRVQVWDCYDVPNQKWLPKRRE